MNKETKQYLDENFKIINEKFEAMDQRFDSLENKVDNNHLELSGKINDIKITVARIDKRSDQDVRAVIKDVGKINKSLKKHKILA